MEPEGGVDKHGLVSHQGNCSLHLFRSIKGLTYAFISRPALCLLIRTHSLSKYLLSAYHRQGLFQALGIEKGIKQITTRIPKTFI